ncbi:hypothetical protein ACJ73_01746 [Blastomyces percursus]|uniref:Glutaredoxin domain-containing protein n=1 Tax=Blastomyces percursus TaxID=1658174 RepID=A0A1J9QFJ1_9EURO|nr:hypothetical protein ACJ73_01746 [Blastomyces percursus]
MSAAKSKVEGIIADNNVDDGAAIQDALADLTHQRTVPNIFIGQKHIGGNSDIQARKSDLLALVSAGATAKPSKA